MKKNSHFYFLISDAINDSYKIQNRQEKQIDNLNRKMDAFKETLQSSMSSFIGL